MEEVEQPQAEWGGIPANETEIEGGGGTTSLETSTGEQRSAEEEVNTDNQVNEEISTKEETSGVGGSSSSISDDTLQELSPMPKIRKSISRRDSGVAFIPGQEKVADVGAVEATKTDFDADAEVAVKSVKEEIVLPPADTPNEAISPAADLEDTATTTTTTTTTTTNNTNESIVNDGDNINTATTTSNSNSSEVTSNNNDLEASQQHEQVEEPKPEESKQVEIEVPKQVETSIPPAAAEAANNSNNPNISTSTSAAISAGARGPSLSVSQQPRAATCTIEARTQAGEIFSFNNVAWDSTVFELKALVYSKTQKFNIQEIRLLRNGKPLDIDHQTISELGFKNSDTVFVIRKLKGLDPPPEAQKSPSNSSSGLPSNVTAVQQTILTVQCPPGQKAGSRLRIRPEGRPPMLVTVPEGVVGGGYFRVMLPPLEVPLTPQEQIPPSVTQQQQQQQQQRLSQRQIQQTPQPNTQLPPRAPKPKIMAVTCPPNHKAGDLMEVIVPNVGRMRVQIPRGVFPGQDFRFRLPD